MILSFARMNGACLSEGYALWGVPKGIPFRAEVDAFYSDSEGFACSVTRTPENALPLREERSGR